MKFIFMRLKKEYSDIFTTLFFTQNSTRKSKSFGFFMNFFNAFEKIEERDYLTFFILFICSNKFIVGSSNPTRRATYEDTNRMANKWCQIAFIFLTIVTPVCFIFPKTIMSYFIYFTTDSTKDAFDLPYAIW